MELFLLTTKPQNGIMLTERRDNMVGFCVEDLRARIKELKKQKGMSNDDLAEKSEIPKSTLTKILGSKTKDPQISNIIKIAKALDTTADYLIFGNQENEVKEDFSEKEKKLVLAYRSHPELQYAVDKLHGMDN